MEWINKDDPRKLFLKPREIVYFTESWPDDSIADKYFEVVKNQIVKRDVWKLIAAGSIVNIDLDETNGWLPNTKLAMFEINLSMKGEVLLYPMWPATDYYFRLERAEFKPDYGSDINRYIGFLDEDDIPFDQTGSILKIYTVKDMDYIRLRLYNDSVDDEKAVLRFMVNRCKLKPLTEKPKIFRTIFHYKDMVW